MVVIPGATIVPGGPGWRPGGPGVRPAAPGARFPGPGGLAGRASSALSQQRRLEQQAWARRLGSVKKADELGKVYDEIDRLGLSQLQLRLRQMNLPAEFGGKDDLVTFLKVWMLWSNLPLAELEKECKTYDVSAEDAIAAETDAEKRQMMLELLRVMMMRVPAFESVGLPVKKIGDAQQIVWTVLQCEQYERLELKDMKKAYEGLGFPDSNEDGMDKKEILHRLRKVTIWNALPLTELLREARDKELLPKGEDEDDREEVLQALYKDMCPRLLGVPAERFDSPEDASFVARHWSSFEKMSLRELREQCKEYSMPLGENNDKEEYLARLRRLALWWGLPMRELEKECAEFGVTPSRFRLDRKEEERRSQLMDLLLASLNEVPVDRFESVEHAVSVAHQFIELQEKSVKELREQCKEWNMPRKEGLPKEEYVGFLRGATLYSELPLKELEKECQEWGTTASKLKLQGSADERRTGLLNFLLAGLNSVPIDRFDSVEAAVEVGHYFCKFQEMDLKSLKEQTKDWNMPLQDSLGRDNYINRLQYAILWYWMPLAELQKDCKEWEVSLSELNLHEGAESERRHRMLDRLLYNLCWETFEAMGVWVDQINSLEAAWRLHDEFEQIDKMNVGDLRVQYSNMGLSHNGLGKQELGDRIKQVRYWFVIPFSALQKECRQHSVTSSGKEEDREELINRLINKAWSAWRPGQGGPGPGGPPWGAPGPSWQQNMFGPGHPAGGYRSFPGGSAPRPPGFWPHPRTGGAAPGAAPPRAGAAPGPGRPPRGPTYPQASFKSRPRANTSSYSSSSEAPKARPVSQRLAGHFQALELSTSATLEDVKKAYKRLALKHHPDKQQGATAGAGAQEFLKVSSAYTALMDYLKSGTAAGAPRTSTAQGR